MSDPTSPDVETADGWEERAEAFERWADQIDAANLKPADTRALQAIARLTDLRKEVEAAILEAVREARRDRRTWAEVGAMLGVTRQAAQHKYAPILVGNPFEEDDTRAASIEQSPQGRRASGQDSTLGANAQPGLVAHADWSTEPNKRWCATAVLEDDGRYRVDAPVRVGDVDTYFSRLRTRAGSSAVVFTGFDFPIGLPASYASKVGFTDFRTALPRLGRDEWSDFYEPARSQSDISIGRPFYPYATRKKGEHRQEHLYGRLGLRGMSDLKRRCERRAQSLFWLIGSNQVGKAAISGWRDLLAPALARDATLSIWPFDGRLDDLLARPGVVAAETYPAEVYRHLGLGVLRGSKQRQSDRAADSSTMRDWAQTNGVHLTKRLKHEIEDGFGTNRNGDDRFDAVVGLFGMLDVVFGNLESGEPRDDTTQIEGWILGYSGTLKQAGLAQVAV